MTSRAPSKSAIDPRRLVQEFDARAERGPFQATHCHHFPKESGPHVVFGVITHGNEFGTLPAALRLQRGLAAAELSAPGPVTIFLGNVEAARRGVRFVDEDLNRVMTFDKPADNMERRRAEELRPILDTAEFFLDLHQTQTPTQHPFWTFPWEGDLGEWARALGGARVGLTRAPGATFSQGKCCLDEYVRGRGRIGLTLEVGERGPDEVQAARAFRVMCRTLEVHSRLLEGASLKKIADASPSVKWYETAEVVPAASQQHRLRDGLSNFTRVHKDELLSPAHAPTIRARRDGCVLFPKFPAPGEPPPPELFRLAVPVDDPAARFGK